MLFPFPIASSSLRRRINLIIMKIYVKLFARSPRLMAALILGNKSDCPSYLNLGKFPILCRASHAKGKRERLTDDVSWIMDEAAWLEQWNNLLQKKCRRRIFKTGEKKMMKFIAWLLPLLNHCSFHATSNFEQLFGTTFSSSTATSPKLLMWK